MKNSMYQKGEEQRLCLLHEEQWLGNTLLLIGQQNLLSILQSQAEKFMTIHSIEPLGIDSFLQPMTLQKMLFMKHSLHELYQI